MTDESFINGTEAVEAAPEAEDTAVSADANPGAPTEEGDPPEPKTFTQEQVTAIVNKENAKQERKLRREWEAQAAQRSAPIAPPDPKQFTDQGTYNNAVVEYKVAETLAQRDINKQRYDAVTSFEEREDDAKVKYSDYQRIARNDDLPITEHMGEVIVASEIGPDVLYHLGQNPKEASRIAGLSPLMQAKEIGKIEAFLNTYPPAKKSSSAPEPITPLGSRASTPSYSTSDPRSVKMSMDDWAAQNMKETSKRR